MDIRIYDGKAEILECKELTKEEVSFVTYLIDKGGYWEFRKHSGIYKVYDKDNNKYKHENLHEIRGKITLDTIRNRMTK